MSGSVICKVARGRGIRNQSGSYQEQKAGIASDWREQLSEITETQRQPAVRADKQITPRTSQVPGLAQHLPHAYYWKPFGCAITNNQQLHE